MITVPVQRIGVARRGVLVWNEGELELRPGTLQADEADTVLATVWGSQSGLELDEPEGDAIDYDRGTEVEITDVATAERFMFKLHGLALAGFRVLWAELEGEVPE